MKLTFQTERWAAIAEEIRPLLLANWKETALDHEKIALDPDFDSYATRDLDGFLHVTTARAEDWEIGEGTPTEKRPLVGYFIAMVAPHPHYQTVLFCFMDVYFLAEQYRIGSNGLQLFLAVEKAMRHRGVSEIIANTKVKHDISPVFERLGWRRTAITYTKLLE